MCDNWSRGNRDRPRGGNSNRGGFNRRGGNSNRGDFNRGSGNSNLGDFNRRGFGSHGRSEFGNFNRTGDNSYRGDYNRSDSGNSDDQQSWRQSSGHRDGGPSRGGGNFYRGGYNRSDSGTSGVQQGWQHSSGHRDNFRGRGNFQGGNRGGYNRAPPREKLPLPVPIELPVMKYSPAMQEAVCRQAIPLIANFFPVFIRDTPTTVYQYIFGVVNTGLKEKYVEKWVQHSKEEVIHAFITESPVCAGKKCFTDGAILYVDSAQLDLQETSQFPFNTTIDGRRENLVVSLKKVADIDLSKIQQFYNNPTLKTANDEFTNELNVLTIMIQYSLKKSESSLQVHRQGFFDITGAGSQMSRNGGFQFLRGFVLSVRLTHYGLAMNLHMASAIALPVQVTTLEQLLCERYRDFARIWQHVSSRELTEYTKGLKFFVTHIPGRPKVRKPVKAIHPVSAGKESFEKDGKWITVKEYFSRNYNININGNYPLVVTSNGSFFPLELCKLDKVQFVSEKKFGLKDERTVYATLDPDLYINGAQKFVEKIAANQTLQGFDVQVETQPLGIKGKVLAKPAMLEDRNFYEAGNISTFLALNLCGHYKFDQFSREFVDKAKARGLIKDDFRNVTGQLERFDVPERISATYDFLDLLEQIANELKPDLILIALPGDQRDQFDGGQMYNLIKTFFETENRQGIKTQCMKFDKLNNPNKFSSIIDNLLEKVNGKLGGTNRLLNVEKMSANFKSVHKLKKTMLIGMDVTHPPPASHDKQSIAAAVGTRDEYFSKFVAQAKVQQKPRMETIDYAGRMVEYLLDEFKRLNGEYPEHVMIIRDGVGKGHYKKIEKEEIPSISNVLYKLNIKFTYVIMSKRIHERVIRQEERKSGLNKTTNNVEAGMVIENTITDPNVEEFILCSHDSPLGTARPAKYDIIENQLHMSMEQVEIFINMNCQTCFRTAKSISLPTVVKYADLCAFRAQKYLEARILNGLHKLVNPNEDPLAEFNEKIKVTAEHQTLPSYI